MQGKEVLPKYKETGPGVNKDYHNEKNLEMEGQFLQKLQNENIQMRKRLGDEISLRQTREQELRQKETIVEELQKTLDQEKRKVMRLEEESVVVKKACKELEERLNRLLAQMRQVLGNKILLSVANKENRLKEKEKVLDELKKTIEHEKQARSGVEEELNQTKIACKELEERLETELAKMRRTLENEIGLRSTREQELTETRTLLDKLQKELRKEEGTRSRVEEELSQARDDCIKFEKSLESGREQMQRTLENEVCLRRKAEQRFQEKETDAVILENKLGDEQFRRRRLEEELMRARTDYIEEKERLEQKLAETERTLNIVKRLHDTQKRQLREKEAIMEEMQRTRFTMEEELSQVRSSSELHTERMENELDQIRRTLDIEISLRNTSEQELREKETVIYEQRTTIEAQQREFETNEAAQRELLHLLGNERQQKTDLEERLRNLQLEMEDEMDRRASAERELNTATECQTSQTRDWIIHREEVVLSEKSLGRGAWGEVREGTFRSCRVAVKKIHDLILSDHNRRLFEREMTIASCCRHPNLLQFIGATNDDGNPLFVTELLDTSLRRLLSQRALSDEEIVSFALDVAKGLNYLHLNRPLPIIHRDISSANVLLWRRDECWRAKLSDYGSANFMRQGMTADPGAIIYSAPHFSTINEGGRVQFWRTVV